MSFQARRRGKLIPSWFWILLVSFPLFVLIRWLVWWFFCPSYKRTASLEIDAPRSDSIPMSLKKDDFSILKGIGPKTATALHQAGIMRFEQLGLMDPEQFSLVLKEHSLPTANADFWQKQATLAAAQDWKELEKLQK
jgi:hypothetical protein